MKSCHEYSFGTHSNVGKNKGKLTNARTGPAGIRSQCAHTIHALTGLSGSPAVPVQAIQLGKCRDLGWPRLPLWCGGFG